jgi:hypothetical protein
MNNSSNRFNNPTQSSMKKTGLNSKDGEFMGSNIGGLGQSGRDFGLASSNSSSLKGRLQTLEVSESLKLE